MTDITKALEELVAEYPVNPPYKDIWEPKLTNADLIAQAEATINAIIAREVLEISNSLHAGYMESNDLDAASAMIDLNEVVAERWGTPPPTTKIREMK